MWKALGVNFALPLVFKELCKAQCAFLQNGHAHQAVHQLLHPRCKLLEALLHVVRQDAYLQHAAQLMARGRAHCFIPLVCT